MTAIPSGLVEQITGQTDVRFESSPNNRRQDPRISLPFVVDVVPVEDGQLAPAIHARLRDISSTGIGIICTQRMHPGDSFLICLPRKEETSVWIVCQVSRCKAVAHGTYAIGAAFIGYREHQASETGTASVPVVLDEPIPSILPRESAPIHPRRSSSESLFSPPPLR